jgi:hypothetical protein
VNGQMEPLLSMRAKEALVLDMVHVGGRHVLELEMQRDVMATSVGGVGAAVTQAVGAPCTMHLMANDGVDYEAGRKVRTFASSDGPYNPMCMYMPTCLAVPPPLVALTFMPDIEPPASLCRSRPSCRWAPTSACGCCCAASPPGPTRLCP